MVLIPVTTLIEGIIIMVRKLVYKWFHADEIMSFYGVYR